MRLAVQVRLQQAARFASLYGLSNSNYVPTDRR